MSITVKREDITLEETRESGFTYSLSDAPTLTTTTWEASLFGRSSRGEMVSMTRSGGTPSVALSKLERAIKELGWEVR